jgi:hypothetical protein
MSKRLGNGCVFIAGLILDANSGRILNGCTLNVRDRMGMAGTAPVASFSRRAILR